MADPSVPTVADVLAVLRRAYPESTAQDWDAVGLVCGRPEAPAGTVLLAVDPVAAVVDEAVEAGAELLVVHHPLLLRGVTSVAADTAKGSAVTRLIEAGCALYVAHTNADAARRGVNEALATALGLQDLRPLEPSSTDASTGIGRVGRLDPPTTLRSFAERVAQVLPATAQGVRVAGDLDAQVRKVALCGGSGDSLFDAVRASGADVYLTADLRHHPASEAREQALLGGAGRPFLVDAAHWASEWPWLEACAELVRSVDGTTVAVSERCTDPWTARIDSPVPHRSPGGPRP